MISTAVAIRIDKYTIRCKELDGTMQVYAHYGLIRSGGIDVTPSDCIASTDPAFTYQFDLYSINVPDMLSSNAGVGGILDATQQLSFDIAGYIDGRRQYLTTLQTQSAYPKLNTYMSVSDNELSIECKDTEGYSAGEHIARALGVALETISSDCDIRYTVLDENFQIIKDIRANVRNADEQADTIKTYLPMLDKNATAMRISIEYHVNVYTLGITLTFGNAMVLADEQLAELIRNDVEEIGDGYECVFDVRNIFRHGIPNADISIDGMKLTTNIDGLAWTRLLRGSYSYFIKALNFADVQSSLAILPTANYENVIMQRVPTSTIIVDQTAVTVLNKESRLYNYTYTGSELVSFFVVHNVFGTPIPHAKITVCGGR